MIYNIENYAHFYQISSGFKIDITYQAYYNKLAFQCMCDWKILQLYHHTHFPPISVCNTYPHYRTNRTHQPHHIFHRKKVALDFLDHQFHVGYLL